MDKAVIQENPFAKHIRSHRISELYGKDGELNKWGEDHLDEIVDKTTLLLVESDIFPKPKKEEKVIVFSPSANTGVFEASLAKKLGADYFVFGGDLAKLGKRKKDLSHIQADAFIPPFSDNSIDVVFDRKGALWYSGNPEEPIGSTEDVLNLLSVYRAKLKQNGLLIIDGNTGVVASTADLLDEANLTNLEGFKSYVEIGDSECKYRIYQKL